MTVSAVNAAVVLFGKTQPLLPHYPQCVLRMARFRGRDTSEFLDNRQELGHAFDLFQRAQRFWRDHLPVAGRIVPQLFERIDDPLYPPAALREALANALCHRDYSIAGGAVSLALFDDRLETSSTGVLPFDLTPADLARPHRSRPWNPLIAQVFYRRGIIEIWGRGTLKMAELTTLPPGCRCRRSNVRPARWWCRERSPSCGNRVWWSRAARRGREQFGCSAGSSAEAWPGGVMWHKVAQFGAIARGDPSGEHAEHAAGDRNGHLLWCGRASSCGRCWRRTSS